MELSISGNALKTLSRSIICLARVGNELVVQASPTQVLSFICFIGSSVTLILRIGKYLVRLLQINCL